MQLRPVCFVSNKLHVVIYIFVNFPVFFFLLQPLVNKREFYNWQYDFWNSVIASSLASSSLRWIGLTKHAVCPTSYTLQGTFFVYYHQLTLFSKYLFYIIGITTVAYKIFVRVWKLRSTVAPKSDTECFEEWLLLSALASITQNLTSVSSTTLWLTDI